MNKTFRLTLSLLAVALLAAFAAACGGDDSGSGSVPDDAVAQIGDDPITKTTFDHWMTVAAKASGQTATVRTPPDFTACVAEKRKTAAKPAKGQPKQTDTQLKQQCRTEYNGLRDQVMSLLISYAWIEGEAKAEGVKATDAEVRKVLETQKKQSFPKEGDYQKFLKQSGQTEQDLLRRFRVNVLSTKIRDKVTKGKDTVTDAQISSYYDKNKARFAQPERRDVRVVLAKSKAKVLQARQALRSGKSWKSVAKQYSTDQASKSQGGLLPAVAKGQLEKPLEDAVFKAKKGQLEGPVKTSFGYYIFQVAKITKATQQTLPQATASIRQLLGSQNQQKALDAFVKKFRANWKAKTNCGQGYAVADCKNAPKPTPTPKAATTQSPPTTSSK